MTLRTKTMTNLSAFISARRALPALCGAIGALLFAAAGGAPAYAQSRAFSAFSPWDLHSTDVLDAADGKDPYDFELYAMFDQSFETGTIQREYHCSNDRVLVPQDDGTYRSTPKGQAGLANDGNCDSGEDRIVSARELDYERIRRRLNLLARFGIYKDLEFHFFLPIVLLDKSTLKMASQSDRPGSLPLEAHCTADVGGAATCSQSSVYREDENGNYDDVNSFFNLDDPDISPERAAVDNPVLGVWWAPYNDERDDTVATWRLGLDYTLNVVDRVKADSKDAVGQGYDELRASTAFSRRFEVMRPFLEVSYSLSNLIEPSSTPFPEYGGGQTLVEPGDRLAVRFGSDVMAWEDQSLGQWFNLDFGGEFVYQFEGRDYTPLFTALGSSACNDNPDCSLTKLAGTEPSNNQVSLRSKGITDVEQFGALRGWLGFDVQPHKNVRFKARAVLAHQLAHFLTFADAGKDNGRQDVGETPTYNRGIIDPDTEEENPVFNQHMDLAGSRFRLASHLDFGFFVTGAVVF